MAESSKVSAHRLSTQSQTAPKKHVKTVFDGYDFMVTMMIEKKILYRYFLVYIFFEKKWNFKEYINYPGNNYRIKYIFDFQIILV